MAMLKARLTKTSGDIDIYTDAYGIYIVDGGIEIQYFDGYDAKSESYRESELKELVINRIDIREA